MSKSVNLGANRAKTAPPNAAARTTVKGKPANAASAASAAPVPAKRESLSQQQRPQSNKDGSSVKPKPRKQPNSAFLAAHGIKPADDNSGGNGKGGGGVIKKSAKNEPGGPEEAVFYKETGDGDLHPKIIQQARRTGQLNLSGRGLVKVPDNVYGINELEGEAPKQGFSMDRVEEAEAWWDYVELNKLILASNKLSTVSPKIGDLMALQTLDLHDNAIERLPGEIGKLENLSRLNLNHNKLKSLPLDFFSLRNLRMLSVSNNQLIEIHDDLSRLDLLEMLDLSHNQLKKLPNSIGYLTKVTNLNLSHNVLTEIPSEISFLSLISTLDMTQNQIETLPESMSDLSKLEMLLLRHNRLKEMPNLRCCSHLKEMHLGNNQLTEIKTEDVENIPNVGVLDLRDNKIASIPDEIINLHGLERLDLTNNDLSTLPYTLGTMPNLKSLLVEGNPMKSIRRDIIQRGTVGLMKYLKSRLTTDELAQLGDRNQSTSPAPTLGSSPPVPDKFSMKNSQSLTMTKKELTALPADAIDNAKEANVQGVDLSKNYFDSMPDALQELLPQIYEFNMSHNRLSQVSVWIGSGVHLQYLNLGNNKLSSLPAEISQCVQLREVALPYNKFDHLPICLFACSKLETIIMCDNQISQIDVQGLSKLNMLAILDLRNNNIGAVPPELGLMKQLKNLSLEGNAFRMPRPQILVKGTEAILAYLRDRIPQ